MLAMRACITNKCKSGEYGVRSPSTGTRGGIAATRFVWSGTAASSVIIFHGSVLKRPRVVLNAHRVSIPHVIRTRTE